MPLINSAEDRENILSRCFGIDDVVVIHFNQRVMHMDWQDFIDELIDEMNLRWIVVGHDFCFGYKGLGTAEKLKAYCAERGVGCDIIPAVCRDGVVVSSTLIRQLIETGEMEKPMNTSAIRIRSPMLYAQAITSERRWVRRQ